MKTLKIFGATATIFFAISIVLAILGVCGIDRQDMLFMSVWALFMTLPFGIFIYSLRNKSIWIIFPIPVLVMLIVFLLEYWCGLSLVPMPGSRSLFCHSLLLFTTLGAVGFYFSDLRKNILTQDRRDAVVLFIFGLILTSILGLSILPDWVMLIPLYAGFAALFYGFRGMMFPGTQNVRQESIQNSLS